MKAEESNFYEWQRKFSTDEQCMAHLIKLRWGNGSQCSYCGHGHGYRNGLKFTANTGEVFNAI